MPRSILGGVLVIGLCAGLATAIDNTRERSTTQGARSVPQLPGIRADGTVQLPNQWLLHPAGTQIHLGDFPVNSTFDPSGSWLAILHAGYGEHEIAIVDLRRARPRLTSRVTLDGTFYGIAFAPDGKRLFASGAESDVVHEFRFSDGYLTPTRKIPVALGKTKFIPGGMTVSRDSTSLFVTGTWGHALAIVSLVGDPRVRHIDLEAESHPYACVLDGKEDRLFVSLWSKAAVAVINLGKGAVESVWPTEQHPTEMVLSADGTSLYVACANSTKVSVIDVATGKPRETLACALYPQAPSGNTPNSIALSRDGKTLLVANADACNLAVFALQNNQPAVPRGFIPTGWYPTSVRINPRDNRIFVCNGKGGSSKPNPLGPDPYARPSNLRQVISALLQGTLEYLDMPGEEELKSLTRRAYACSPLKPGSVPTAERPSGNPIPAKVGDASPITHCIYIIKENRTYDQVLGDAKEGNGDPNLCIFGEALTPNHHKLARDYVLLDNFYADGEISADGHEWSMGAYATDYVEKLWPLTYRRGSGAPRKFPSYPAEGVQDAIARPAGGYLWDRCAAAGVSYRSYGEWVKDGSTPNDPAVARVKALEGHIDPMYRGFDMSYPDQKRADRFLSELVRFEREGSMPRLQIVRLPCDHTSGTRRGSRTPRAMVADNDLAMGRIVEGVSRSKFWPHTAIFILEDDAQNGPDHVDCHRTVALIASPYTKRSAVDSSMYSTSSMLRTMELILGLEPMSQFDAAARPMYASFQGQPDARPYTHLPATVNLEERNATDAFGADQSARMDFSKEDQADDLLLNEVVWRSIRGAASPMPAPVRAAFLSPRSASQKEDD